MAKVITTNNIKVSDKAKSKLDDNIVLLDRTLEKIDVKRLSSIRDQLKNFKKILYSPASIHKAVHF